MPCLISEVIKLSFTKKIKKLRLDNKLSQEQFANRIGVSKKRIVQWELGQSYPEVQDYIAIGDAFHVDIDYLLNDGYGYTTNVRNRRRKKRKAKRRLKLLRLVLLTFFLFICYKGCTKIWLYYTNLNDNINIEKRNGNISYTEMHRQYIAQLSQMKGDSKKINYIIDNINEYPIEVLDLLVKNPETIDFVSDYLNRQNYDENIEVLADFKKGKIPLFLQWDKRWGYRQYGDNIIAINGCGPVCLSMVAVGLTGDTTLNPKVISDYSEKKGYFENEVGTSWLLMSEGAKRFGLRSSEIILDEAAITKELKNGRPIIASVGPGDFTTKGHFIVLKGMNSEGKVLIHDPNSMERSNKEWDLKLVMGQVRNLWSFSKAK